MEKSAPSRSVGQIRMEAAGLTELEMEVALQLIQLSGDGGAAEHSPEESVGDTPHEIVSGDVNLGQLEALPRRKMRLRLLDDVYGVIKKRVKKSSN